MAFTPQETKRVRNVRLIGGGDRLAFFEDADTGEDVMALRFTLDAPIGLQSVIGHVGTLVRVDVDTGEQITERARVVEIRRDGPLW